MTVRDFFPKGDALFIVWYNNFLTKLKGYAQKFGLGTADMLAVANDYAALAYMVNQTLAARADTKQRVSFKRALLNGPAGVTPVPFPGPFTPAQAPTNAVPPGVVPRLRSLVKRIKASPNYTSQIGLDLGIEKAPVLLPGIVKPSGKVTPLPKAQVQIKFVKRGYNGVLVESQRGDGSNWETLGGFTHSPVLDTRPLLVPNQPETRAYRLRYLKENNPIGYSSDTLTTTAQM